MKKFLLSLTLFTALLGITLNATSQGTGACKLTVSNVQVSIVGDPESQSATQCLVTFNVSFDLDNNSGNKFIFLHSFLESDYGAGSFICPANGAQTPPTNTRLGTSINQVGKSFFDLALDNNVPNGAVGVPVPLPVLTTYGPDPSVQLITPTNSPGLTVTKTFIGGTTNRITITNATVLVNQSCASNLLVKTDIWSSNSNASSSKAQCFICGNEAITSTFNNPAISDRINCANPSTYNLNITTTSSVNQEITYKVYIDQNDNGTLETIGENKDIEVYSSPSITINNLIGHSVSGQNYTHGGDIVLGDKNLLVELKSPSLANSRLQILTFDPNIECTPLQVLPVSYASFTATRANNNQVVLEWETAMEENNRGFHVQRNVDGAWKNIGFVFSQANGGNSSEVLKYAFKDANNSKGISQYRILQVDIDGKGKYSQIRSVHGLETAARVVLFPNPSNTGSFSLLFEDATSVRDVVVSDVSGRMVKQFKGVSGSTLAVDGLMDGFYTVQVANRTSGTASVEKVIIKKR